RRQSSRGGEIQHVGCSKLIGSAAYQVSIDTLLSVRGQYRDGAGILHRRIGALEVDEGEQLIFEVAKGNQRPAEISTIVLSAAKGPRQTLSISGPTVGVEPLACRLVEGAAVVLGAAAPGSEFDVRAALRAGIRAQAAGLHRYFLDCAQTHRDGHEEYSPSAFKTVGGVIDSRNSYVGGPPSRVFFPGFTGGRRHRSGSEAGQDECGTPVGGLEFVNYLRRKCGRH